MDFGTLLLAAAEKNEVLCHRNLPRPGTTLCHVRCLVSQLTSSLAALRPAQALSASPLQDPEACASDNSIRMRHFVLRVGLDEARVGQQNLLHQVPARRRIHVQVRLQLAQSLAQLPVEERELACEFMDAMNVRTRSGASDFAFRK